MEKTLRDIDVLDLEILRRLRKDSRCPLRRMADLLSVPLSTVFNRMRALSTKYLVRTTVHLDLAKVFPIHVWMWIVPTKIRVLVPYTKTHPAFNTLCRVGPGYVFVAEGFFASIAALEESIGLLQENGAGRIRTHFVVETLCLEEFFTRSQGCLGQAL